MIYFLCKGLIAHILLLNQLLTSCDNPRYLRITPSSEIARRSYTFIKPPGYKIVLEPHGDSWQAMVHDNRFPGLRRAYPASVAFGKGYDLANFITKNPAYQSRHMHLLSSNKDKPMVYIGALGLKGGGLFNWFGCKKCTMFGCFDDVWRCICGYKCSDDSCWTHCTKHYQDHKCSGCGTVNRCPKYYACQNKNCHNPSYCSNCCGCYERQRQEEIRLIIEHAEIAASQKAEEAARQKQLRDQWAREEERARIRQQQERERQAWLREQERERIRQQEERARQAILSKLEACLASAPIAQATSSHMDISIVKVGIPNEADQKENYTFIFEDQTIKGSSKSSVCSESIDSKSEELTLPHCTSRDSILSLTENRLAAGTITRCTSTGSIFSTSSRNSHSDKSSNSLPELWDVSSTFSESMNDDPSPTPSIDQDRYDQSATLGPNTNTNTPIDAISSPDASLIPSFLSNYTAHLSSEEQNCFYESAGKFIEEKLPQVEIRTQQEIIDYFTYEGVLYPSIVAHYAPSEWIVQSLLKEVVAYPDENDYCLNNFSKQWVNIIGQYPISAQVALLKSLHIKKLRHSFSLLDISEVIDFVLQMGESGYAIVCSEASSWLSDLKRTWLAPKLALLTHLSESDQDQLGSALSDMGWGIHMLNTFIQSIKDEVSLEPIKELLSAIQIRKVPDSLVYLTITIDPTDPEKSKAKQWAHTITYQSLLYKINLLSPKLAYSIEQPLYNLLASSCSAQLIEQVIRDHLDLINDHIAEFAKVLELLYDYQVREDICALAFSRLPEVAGSDWVDKVDQAVSSALFENAQEYTIDALIEQIADGTSAFTPEGLRASYDAVVQSYRSPSVVLQSTNDSSINKFKNKPIYAWNTNALSLWAKTIKSSSCSVSQSELIAGVQHAVKLHHKFFPRDTQLLSLLTLLNPTEGRGRLAQINTGEGKSLIVAMLAAIHGLQGKKVDVITTSTELSIPEVKKQQPFFESLSLKVAENSHMDTKSSAYKKSDVVYGIAGDFQADILRTEFLGKDVRGDRGFNVVIVDEVDSMLFDNRSHSVRLSEQTPGMTHLELPLGAIWEYMHRIAGQMTTIDDQLFFISEPGKRVGKTIQLDSGAPWESCAEIVSDKRSFFTEKIHSHLKKLLRELNGEEKSEYETFKALNNQITALEQSIANTTNDKEKQAKITSCKSLSEKLKRLPWSQRYPVLDVPVHLRNFARLQIPYWTKSALNAFYSYKKNVHYTLKDHRIIPVNYNETGVLQPNMVWSDGLTQFLQLKEGLSIDPEGVSTNFISNISFFKRYGSSIYGLTGTLGEQSTKNFLQQMYHVDTVVIPPYQHRNILDNAASPYLCKELHPIVLSDRKEWFQAVIDHALSHASHGRGVLIICKSIREVEKFYQQLGKKYDEAKIFPYTGKETTLEKKGKIDSGKIDSGEIIIATNIAGRGTDLATSPSVESHGGIYVAVTFLPESYRVEMQNVGRTARSGNKGMAQLIIYDPIRSDIEDIKKHRAKEEVVATGKASEDAQKMLFQDRLFNDFCSLESEYLPSVTECDLTKKWKDLSIAYKKYQAEALSEAKISEYVDKEVLARKLDLIQRSLGSLSVAEASKITEADKQVYREKAAREATSNRPYFKEAYKKQVLNNFCNAQSHLPEKLISCLKEDPDI